MVWCLSVNIKFLSFQECFLLQLYSVVLESRREKRSLGLDGEFPFSLVKGVKVIWRWPCKSYFPLDWLFPMPSFAVPSLCLSPCLLCWTLLSFFPLRSRDLFSWPHFCISLAVIMQMSIIAHTTNCNNMLKKFLPSFLLSLDTKNCWILNNCRNTSKFIPFSIKYFLEVLKALSCMLDNFQISVIPFCSENGNLHWRFLVHCTDFLQLKPIQVEAAAVSPSP